MGQLIHNQLALAGKQEDLQMMQYMQHVVKERGGARSRVPREMSFTRDEYLDSDSETEVDIAPEPPAITRKEVRGPTCMPKLWGQPPDEFVKVSFNALGQPNDESNTSTLAHFEGTIARNGRYCPLHYKDWRLMPNSYKDEMLKAVKAKFQLASGTEPRVLKSINKKWRSWKNYVKDLTFDSDAPTEQQLLDISNRVDDEQYKILAKHWMSDNFKKKSKKNKESRAELDLFHRMGKKSYEVKKEIMKKKLGRYPTRAELFEECYGKGASAELKNKIKQMKEIEAKEPPNTNGPKCDDAFATVMGSDKQGRVRMYGTGVMPADVYGLIPSRDASYRLAMEYKDKYDELSAKVEFLSAQISGKMQSSLQSDQDTQTSLVNKRPAASTSRPNQIRVRSRVVLKSLEDINKIVARGYITEIDCVKVHREELGPGWCEIVIQSHVEKDVRLFKPYGHIETIEDSLGAPIAWPLSLVALDEDYCS